MTLQPFWTPLTTGKSDTIKLWEMASSSELNLLVPWPMTQQNPPFNGSLVGLLKILPIVSLLTWSLILKPKSLIWL
jgi:hypothetical protein